MSSELTTYSVVLALPVVPVGAGHAALGDLQEEFDARPHLDRPHVSWDAQQQRPVVRVVVKDVTAEAAGANMVEELFEIAAGILPDFHTMRVELLGVAVAER